MIRKQLDVYFGITNSANIADYTRIGSLPVYIGESVHTWDEFKSYWRGISSAINFTDRPPLSGVDPTYDQQLSNEGTALLDYMGFTPSSLYPSIIGAEYSKLYNPFYTSYSLFSIDNLISGVTRFYMAFTTDDNDYILVNQYDHYVDSNTENIAQSNTTYIGLKGGSLTNTTVYYDFVSGGYNKRSGGQNSVTVGLISKTSDGKYVGVTPRCFCRGSATDKNNSGGYSSGTRYYDIITNFFEALDPEPPTDPYAPGGTSGPSSGTGTFDLTSDTISIPGLPTLSATNAGLVTVYIPTATQLNKFASLLFGKTFLDAFLNAITTLFVDPLEAVIGLSIIPVAPTLATAKQVSIAFIGLSGEDGPLMMQPAATQYVEVDCGTIFIDEFSGSALDYSPYSKFHIYLPYIGTRELSTDEIRNKNLHVVYHIDIVSGSCVALLEVEGSVLYQFAGNCATPIPINGRDFSRMVTAGIQLAASFVGSTAGAGVGAVAAGNIGKPDDYISTDSSFNTLIKTLDSDEGVTPSANKAAGGKIDAEHLVSSTAGVVAGMKSHIQHASGIGGSAGMLGVQKPYLIAEIPRQSLAADYNKFVGYPSNITSLLGDLTGFTQIEMIHLKGIPCTETELAEIDKMLRNGVIL